MAEKQKKQSLNNGGNDFNIAEIEKNRDYYVKRAAEIEEKYMLLQEKKYDEEKLEAEADKIFDTEYLPLAKEFTEYFANQLESLKSVEISTAYDKIIKEALQEDIIIDDFESYLKNQLNKNGKNNDNEIEANNYLDGLLKVMIGVTGCKLVVWMADFGLNAYRLAVMSPNEKSVLNNLEAASGIRIESVTRLASTLIRGVRTFAVLVLPRLLYVVGSNISEGKNEATIINELREPETAYAFNLNSCLTLIDIAELAYNGGDGGGGNYNRLTDEQFMDLMGDEQSFLEMYDEESGLFRINLDLKIWLGKHTTKDEYIISFAGTSSAPETLQADYLQLMIPTPLYVHAAGFVLKAASKASETGNTVTVVGHSLGGGLTQFSTANYINKTDFRNITGTGFNSAGLSLCSINLALSNPADIQTKTDVANSILHVVTNNDFVSRFGGLLGHKELLETQNNYGHRIADIRQALNEIDSNVETHNLGVMAVDGGVANAGGTNTAGGVNISAGIDCTILKTDLSGVFERKKLQIGDRSATKTALLILPTSPPNGGMSILELIKEVNEMVQSFTGTKGTLSEAEIKNILTQFKLSFLENVSIELRQVFILYDKTTLDTADGEPGEVVESTFEYAINIVIKNNIEPDESMKLFNIKSVSLSIWNTTQPKILSRMALGNIQELLAK